jgi:hypothetical protein
MDEKYLSTKPDPWIVHGDGGGTNLWINFGPYDLAPGDSVVIVLAEGVAGLSREKCYEVGALWRQAYIDPGFKGPFTMPDGSTTTDKDVYKDAWFYQQGLDHGTFSHAKRNYDLKRYSQPPLHPQGRSSGGDRISAWTASPPVPIQRLQSVPRHRERMRFSSGCLAPPAAKRSTMSPLGGPVAALRRRYRRFDELTGSQIRPDAREQPFFATTQPAYLRRQRARPVVHPHRADPTTSPPRACSIGEPDKIMF